MATVFVLARTAMLFTNALGYPFYILGGVLVPVAFLPGWLRPVSRLVFLSWSSDGGRLLFEDVERVSRLVRKHLEESQAFVLANSRDRPVSITGVHAPFVRR